jgi:hypothetical protein
MDAGSGSVLRAAVLVAVRRVSTTAPNANGSATRRPDVSETEALRAALMDEFDEVEWQVEAHVRSCPDREGETTQSCDLRTAWDALLAALASPEPTPDSGLDVERLAKAMALVYVTGHPIHEAVEHWESYRTDATELIAAYGAAEELDD